MRIAQYPMAPGNWSLRLRPDTPEEILTLVDIQKSRTNFAGLGTIIVTPNEIDSWVGLPGIAQHAFYVGVYLTQEDRREMSGHGLEWWLAHPDGASHSALDMTGARTFAQMITDALNMASDGAVTQGTIHAVAGTMEIDTYDYADTVANLDASANLKSIMARFAAEWKINPANLAFDAGYVTDLYGSTPAAYFHPNAKGPESGMPILTGTARPRVSVEGYRDNVDIYSYYTSTVNQTLGQAARSSPIHWATPWATFSLGPPLTEMRYDGTIYGSAAEVTNLAAGILAQIPEIDVSAILDVINYDPSLQLCGKWIGLHDRLNGLYDRTAAGVWIGGEYCPPLESRVVGLEFAPPPNAGVYLLTSDGDAASTSLRDLHNISRWVDHDDNAGTAQITCGALEPSWTSAVRRMYARLYGR